MQPEQDVLGAVYALIHPLQGTVNRVASLRPRNHGLDLRMGAGTAETEIFQGFLILIQLREQGFDFFLHFSGRDFAGQFGVRDKALRPGRHRATCRK